MSSSSTVRDGLDTTDRNHNFYIEPSEMRERDKSLDPGTTVATASELGTSLNFDSTALKSILPQSIAEEILHPPSSDLPNTREFARSHYRQILFSLANNFAGLDGADMKQVIRFLQEETSQELFQLICGDSRYSARAIAQSVFRGAIELGDARLIGLLLGESSTGIDVNGLWCDIQDRRYTPIERVCLLRHEQAIKVLLEHGAKVNRTDLDRLGPHGALECAVSPVDKENTRIDPQIFRMILKDGHMSANELDCLIRRQDGEFVGLIMSEKASENIAKWSERGTFRDAVLFLDDRTAVAVIRTMLDVGADLNFHVKESVRDPDNPRRVIDAAARHGNVETIELLLRSGALITNETLIFAVISGNRTLMRLLLDRGASVNSRLDSKTIGGSRTTPLAEAIRLQSAETIELFEQYAEVRLNDRHQFSAAILAASEVGNIPFIERLLRLLRRKRGPRAMAVASALEIAIKEGQDEAARMLIDTGIYMGAHEACDRRSPLVQAVNRRNAAFVHLLLKVDVQPYDYGNPRCSKALRNAIEWGDCSIVETLIRAGAAVRCLDSRSSEPALLALAVKRKDHVLVQLLLDAGADVNANRQRYAGANRQRYADTNGTALEAALVNEDISTACYLLDRGADPVDSLALGKAMVENPQFFDLLLKKHTIRYSVVQPQFGCRALTWAVELGDQHTIRLMLDKGLDASSLTMKDARQEMRAPFGYAIANSTVEVIGLFLQKGCNPNSIVLEAPGYYDASYRETAFLAAIDTGSVSKVKLLHRHGADVNFPAHTRVKHTPLQRAAAKGSTDIIELLVRLGAEVNAPAARSGGGTALQLAAIGGYIPVACLLLNYQADVNAPASKMNGRMALEGAAEHGRLDMLQLLLNAGAGNEGKDQQQFERAKALARGQGHSHITDLLEDYLQQKRQEDEPVMSADQIDEVVRMWDPSWDIDGIDVAQQKGQEDEPVLPADQIDEDVGMWDPSWYIDSNDVALMDW